MLALLPLLLHHSVDLALYVAVCVVAALGYRRHGSTGWLLSYVRRCSIAARNVACTRSSAAWRSPLRKAAS